ncbi:MULTISPECIES: hypothetical protein [Pseudomonas]|uniref:hypothetical protein n=1 Tax=Pseudomonas TaxID=286 RepID=UPI000F01CBFC|nr:MULTISPECIES: hypothetical protein [Pseudomonas]MBD8615615.1 hypothetical protein [Pseudomonas putida]MBD8681733.1 hypothetical protein [Pseudomonas sp. CFBP 13719]
MNRLQKLDSKPDGKVSFAENAVYTAMIPMGAAYLSTCLLSFVLYGEVMNRGLDSPLLAQGVPALAAAVVGTSIGLAALGNLDKEHLRNAGTAVKNLGRSFVDGISQMGKNLGLIDEGKTPICQAIDAPSSKRSYWASTALDSTRMMLAAPLLFSSVMAGIGIGYLPFVGQGNYGAAAVQAGAMGAVAAVTALAQIGLTKVKQDLKSDEKFSAAAAMAKPQDPFPMVSRPVVRDLGMEP